MTQFITSVFSKKFIDSLPLERFPLTHAMCDKNAYETHIPHVLMDLQLRYGKLMSVVLYTCQWDGIHGIHVYSFEVTADCRLLDYGTRAMNHLKDTTEKIVLNSLAESKIFYEKMGFSPTSENGYTWRKDNLV